MNSPNESGEVKFAKLLGTEDEEPQYIVAKWQDERIWDGFAREWDKHTTWSYWFQEQKLKIITRDNKDNWYERKSFSLSQCNPNLRTESGDSRIKELNPLSAEKIDDSHWMVKFEHFYTHHLGWLTTEYELIFDLGTMEVKYTVVKSDFDPD